MGQSTRTGVFSSQPASRKALRPYAAGCGSNVHAVSVPSSVEMASLPRTVCDSGLRVMTSESRTYFAHILSMRESMMIGSLGFASSENKISVGYGAEAGHMDSLIERMCAKYVRDSLVITRNPESQTVLGKLAISTELGTDTAWTFEPHPAAYGRKALRDAGWDGKTPDLVL